MLIFFAGALGPPRKCSHADGGTWSRKQFWGGRRPEKPAGLEPARGNGGGQAAPGSPPPRGSNFGPYGEVRRGQFVAVNGVRQRIPHAVHPLGEGVGGLEKNFAAQQGIKETKTHTHIRRDL